jgi:hypothetical protein
MLSFGQSLLRCLCFTDRKHGMYQEFAAKFIKFLAATYWLSAGCTRVDVKFFPAPRSRLISGENICLIPLSFNLSRERHRVNVDSVGTVSAWVSIPDLLQDVFSPVSWHGAISDVFCARWRQMQLRMDQTQKKCAALSHDDQYVIDMLIELWCWPRIVINSANHSKPSRFSSQTLTSAEEW